MTADFKPGNLNFELRNLLNAYSCERYSNTPDFILAEFMLTSLRAFNEAALARDRWHGIKVTVPHHASERD